MAEICTVADDSMAGGKMTLAQAVGNRLDIVMAAVVVEEFEGESSCSPPSFLRW